MNSFQELIAEATVFLKSQNNLPDNYTAPILEYINFYMFSRGITSIYEYSNANEIKQFSGILDEFYIHSQNDKELENLFLSLLDFLIWIKLNYELPKLELRDTRYIKRTGLEYSPFINRILLNETIDPKDKLHIILFLYCSILENIKNVIQEEIIFKIWSEEKCEEDIQKKKHISLGDFKEILFKFEKKNQKKPILSGLINEELRNKINHSDYELLEDKLRYYRKNGDSVEITRQELNRCLVLVAIFLQFFTGFYLRLFRSNSEIVEHFGH